MPMNFRSNERYSVPDSVLVHFKPEHDDDVIGRILNISGGGLAFEYIRLWDQEKNLNSGLPSSINILASGCRALAEAPCRVAYCQTLTRNNAFLTSIPTFQCGVAFSNLTSEHVRQLDMILESCGGSCHMYIKMR